MSLDWLATHRGVLRWVAVGAPILLAAVLALLRDELTPSTASLVLVLAVVGASASGDRVAGVASAVSAAVAFDFFLTVPYYSLSIYDRDNVELAIVLVVVGLVVTELALWGHRQQAVARERSGYIDGVLGLSDVIATGSDAALPRTVGAAITTVLGIDRVAWVAGEPSPNAPVVGRDGVVHVDGRDLRVDRRGLPTDLVTVIPVSRGEIVIGHFTLVAATRVVRPGRDQLRAAVLLAEQMTRQQRPPAEHPAGRAR